MRRGHDAGHDPLHGCRNAGSRRGCCPSTPFPYTFFDVVGFQRRLTRTNAGFPLQDVAGPAARRSPSSGALRPRVVVSVGGYASMPAVFAARKLHVPLVVVSYDRLPGRASALAARRAAACAVAFPDSRLPRATLTGAPGPAGDPRCRPRARPGRRRVPRSGCPPIASRSSSSADRRDRACSTRRCATCSPADAGDRDADDPAPRRDPVRGRRRARDRRRRLACATNRSATRTAWRSSTPPPTC